MAGDERTPAGRVEALLQRIAMAADLESTVLLHEDEDALVAEFVGEDAQALLADHGRTID
ncbi:MAG: hypothetical protein JO120_04555, partial [Solirubrobacterales bacterium]|nr:hypothetical protein [Solirubrobacterales bacterium]